VTGVKRWADADNERRIAALQGDGGHVAERQGASARRRRGSAAPVPGESGRSAPGLEEHDAQMRRWRTASEAIWDDAVAAMRAQQRPPRPPWTNSPASHGAEGLIADADSEATSEAVEARKAVLAGRVVSEQGLKGASGLPRGLQTPGEGFRPRPPAGAGPQRQGPDHALGALSQSANGEGQGLRCLTAKALAVLEALLWGFHNARSGLCFPSYETIAEAAGCARSTVAEAIKALEDTRILTWVQRIKRVRERVSDLLGDSGWQWRVERTSNAYNFRDPGSPDSSNSEKPTGTTIQEFFSSIRGETPAQIDGSLPLEAAFARVAKGGIVS
jgi:hypothetical protein